MSLFFPDGPQSPSTDGDIGQLEAWTGLEPDQGTAVEDSTSSQDKNCPHSSSSAELVSHVQNNLPPPVVSTTGDETPVIAIAEAPPPALSTIPNLPKSKSLSGLSDDDPNYSLQDISNNTNAEDPTNSQVSKAADSNTNQNNINLECGVVAHTGVDPGRSGDWPSGRDSPLEAPAVLEDVPAAVPPSSQHDCTLEEIPLPVTTDHLVEVTDSKSDPFPTSTFPVTDPVDNTGPVINKDISQLVRNTDFSVELNQSSETFDWTVGSTESPSLPLPDSQPPSINIVNPLTPDLELTSDQVSAINDQLLRDEILALHPDMASLNPEVRPRAGTFGSYNSSRRSSFSSDISVSSSGRAPPLQNAPGRRTSMVETLEKQRKQSTPSSKLRGLQLPSRKVSAGSLGNSVDLPTIGGMKASTSLPKFRRSSYQPMLPDPASFPERSMSMTDGNMPKRPAFGAAFRGVSVSGPSGRSVSTSLDDSATPSYERTTTETSVHGRQSSTLPRSASLNPPTYLSVDNAYRQTSQKGDLVENGLPDREDSHSPVFFDDKDSSADTNLSSVTLSTNTTEAASVTRITLEPPKVVATSAISMTRSADKKADAVAVPPERPKVSMVTLRSHSSSAPKLSDSAVATDSASITVPDSPRSKLVIPSSKKLATDTVHLQTSTPVMGPQSKTAPSTLPKPKVFPKPQTFDKISSSNTAVEISPRKEDTVTATSPAKLQIRSSRPIPSDHLHIDVQSPQNTGVPEQQEVAVQDSLLQTKPPTQSSGIANQQGLPYPDVLSESSSATATDSGFSDRPSAPVPTLPSTAPPPPPTTHSLVNFDDTSFPASSDDMPPILPHQPPPPPAASIASSGSYDSLLDLPPSEKITCIHSREAGGSSMDGSESNTIDSGVVFSGHESGDELDTMIKSDLSPHHPKSYVSHSREDLSEGRGSLVCSPDVNAPLSPTTSEADSGIYSTKAEQSRTETGRHSLRLS